MRREVIEACLTAIVSLIGLVSLAACGASAPGAAAPNNPLSAATAVATTTGVLPTSTAPTGAVAQGSPIRLVPGVVPDRTQVPAPYPTSSPTAPGTDFTVTHADNGKKLRVRFAHSFLLALDPAWEWTVTIERPNVITREKDFPGTQGIYWGNSPESTRLSAVGQPLCRKSQPPCSDPARTFEVDITVDYNK